MSTELYVDVFEADYSAVHNLGMEHDIPKLMQAMLEKLDCTQTELAARLSERGKNGLKIQQPQISRWVNGQKPEILNYERIVAVAKTMGLIDDVRSEDVAASIGTAEKRTVKVKGYVGASSEAVYYRIADEYLEEVAAPDGVSDQTIALRVRGESLGASFDNWLVFYDDVRSPITADMMNELCVVGLADDRLLVKKIQRKDGKLVLVSNNGEPDIEDVQIEWAALVTTMRRR